LPTGEVLLAGGYATGAALPTTEIYHPSANAWRAGPPLIAARHDHQVTLLPGGRILLTGGLTDAMTCLAAAEIFDPAQNRWLPAGTMAMPRAHHGAVLLADGRVLVTGGVDGR